MKAYVNLCTSNDRLSYIANWGCQMLLGVDWLQTLDELTLNFRDQSVRPFKEGKTWEFRGVQVGIMKLMQAEVMDRIMH